MDQQSAAKFLELLGYDATAENITRILECAHEVEFTVPEQESDTEQSILNSIE